MTFFLIHYNIIYIHEYNNYNATTEIIKTLIIYVPNNKSFSVHSLFK